MAQDFAKAFYRSKQWQQTRAAYIKSKHGICERCGKASKHMIVHHKTRLNADNINDISVTLNPEGLELVCWQCHNEIDHDHLEDDVKLFQDDGNYLPEEPKGRSYTPYRTSRHGD